MWALVVLPHILNYTTFMVHGVLFSLLPVGGGNRRTATVISKGFSSLFVLSKQDLHRTLVDYPDAEETMKKKAK